MAVTLTDDLVLLDVDAGSQYELLEAAADNLRQQGFVKESYKEAVIEREKIFATGLPTLGSLGVAIPHTDIEHVKRAAISFCRLKKPVEFVVMGDESSKVDVAMIFMLALKEAHSQLGMLQGLMNLLQDEEALAFLEKEKEKKNICRFLKENLPDVA